jgi:hypothetical protein
MVRPWSLKLGMELMDYLRKTWHGMAQLQSLTTTIGTGSTPGAVDDGSRLIAWMAYLELN